MQDIHLHTNVEGRTLNVTLSVYPSLTDTLRRYYSEDEFRRRVRQHKLRYEPFEPTIIHHSWPQRFLNFAILYHETDTNQFAETLYMDTHEQARAYGDAIRAALREKLSPLISELINSEELQEQNSVGVEVSHAAHLEPQFNLDGPPSLDLDGEEPIYIQVGNQFYPVHLGEPVSDGIEQYKRRLRTKAEEHRESIEQSYQAEMELLRQSHESERQRFQRQEEELRQQVRDLQENQPEQVIPISWDDAMHNGVHVMRNGQDRSLVYLLPITYRPEKIEVRYDAQYEIPEEWRDELWNDNLMLAVKRRPGAPPNLYLLDLDTDAGFDHYHATRDDHCLGNYHPSDPVTSRNLVAIRDELQQMLTVINDDSILRSSPNSLPEYAMVRDNTLRETNQVESPETGAWTRDTVAT